MTKSLPHSTVNNQVTKEKVISLFMDKLCFKSSKYPNYLQNECEKWAQIRRRVPNLKKSAEMPNINVLNILN